jgi:hypothetical protein
MTQTPDPDPDLPTPTPTYSARFTSESQLEAVIAAVMRSLKDADLRDDVLEMPLSKALNAFSLVVNSSPTADEPLSVIVTAIAGSVGASVLQLAVDNGHAEPAVLPVPPRRRYSDGPHVCEFCEAVSDDPDEIAQDELTGMWHCLDAETCHFDSSEMHADA